MKLIEIKIQDLFGMLNYTVPLDKNEITMLTGPNGYGKTMILKILYSILANDLHVLFNLKFGSIDLSYQGGMISVQHGNDNKSLFIKFYRENGELELNEEILQPENKSIEFKKNDIKWNLDIINLIESRNSEIKEKVLVTSKHLGNVFKKNSISFIKADRLQNNNGDESVIDICANKLSKIMEASQDESAAISQKLDASFPIRLFDRLEENKRFASHSIDSRLKGVQDKRQEYKYYGLIQSENGLMSDKATLRDSSNEYLGVLDLYIDDTLDKLSPFEILYKKLNLFEKILESKVLAFKKISINIGNGFSFTNSKGDIVERNMLSSGEQNQIVLLFNLIFDFSSEEIILIDEPEISLHVAWQKTFLESLKEIQSINKFEKVIIATHSPQVISKNWELTFDLYDALNIETKSSDE